MAKDLEKSIELVNQVRAILKRRTVLTTNKATMLAISGGQDSACLIAIAVQIRDQWKGPFGIISCNHLWQHDSFYGLFHACRLAFLTDRPLYFVAAPFDVFNEADARSWRYNTIQRIGSLYHFSTICTGHTASDRVETILFNFVRGSGIRGLSSLGWNRWFIGSYPNQYHSANFEGTASSQSSAFFDPKPPLAAGASCMQEARDARLGMAVHPQGVQEGAPKVGAQKVGDGEGRRGHTDVRCLVARIVGLGGRVGGPLSSCIPCLLHAGGTGCTTFKAPAPTHTKQRPHSNHPHPVPFLVEKQQLLKWYLLLAQFFQEGQPIYIKARNIDGKSMALHLSRARDASFCSFLVLSTKFFGINRCLPSRRMGSLIRPLLSLSRNDVKKLCQFWGLPIYPDVTNQTVAFSRNRIRKQLLPALRVVLNPQIDSVLSQSAEIMFAERLQQDLLASKLLRAYQHVPRLERGRLAEEKGNQAKCRSHGMKRQTVQRSTRALMEQVKPRFCWDGGIALCGLGAGGMGALLRMGWGQAGWGQGPPHPSPTRALLARQAMQPPTPIPCPQAPQPPVGPKRTLTSADMSVVRATPANYGRALVSKSRDLQAVWIGLGKTGAFLGAREPCHRQKQYTSLLQKRRGCLFLPQVGVFFTTSSLSSVNVIQSF